MSNLELLMPDDLVKKALRMAETEGLVLNIHTVQYVLVRKTWFDDLIASNIIITAEEAPSV